MKRYNIVEHSYGDGTTCMDIMADDEGQFVKYDDIKHVLENTSRILEPGEVAVKRKELVRLLEYWNGDPNSAVDAIEEIIICIEEIFSEADEVNDLECKIMELQEVIEKLEKRLKKVKDMMPQALKDQTDDYARRRRMYPC